MPENDPLDYDKDEWVASLKVGDMVCDCRYKHSKIKELPEWDGKGDRYIMVSDGHSFSAYHCCGPVDERHEEHWAIYLLKCSDGSFYCGITNNLNRRLEEHNKGGSKGAKYTRSRLPVKLVFSEWASSKSAALKREAAIKKMTRTDKLKLIKENK